MSEIKGIDVSRWNGNIDWKTVANYGMGFAILRITEKDNVIDSTFEANYKGCTENKIPVGVYKYSYATNVSQIKEEANIVIKTLKSRKLDYPVFLDIEDKCQENISKEEMLKMIKAFRSIVVKAGYKFGIYCGNYWYKTKLPEEAKKYDCWLAAYPSNDDGTLQERLRPSEGIGWQYSSKATIPGIPTKVDRNVFYKDYTKGVSTAEKPSDSSNKITITLTVDQVIDAMIKIAEAEIGYLEKKSNSQLDDKTANAGYNNYTKYWRDIKPEFQGQPYCAGFVSWVFMKAFGLETAKKLLKHWPYVYCPTLGNLFTKYTNPKVGDIVIFYRNGTFAHTGIVTKVDGDYFETIEGNTSGGSTIIANGGGVCRKSYYNSNLPGTKFCRPDYSIVKSLNTSATSKPSSSNSNSNPVSDPKQLVKDAQIHLNNFVNAGLEVDGIVGPATKKAFISAIQFALNKDYKYNFSCKGVWGPKTEAALGKVSLKKGSKGYLVTALEIGMLIHSINPEGVESPGIMGDGLVAAVKEYQKSNKLTINGIADVNTFKSLIK